MVLHVPGPGNYEMIATWSGKFEFLYFRQRKTQGGKKNKKLDVFNFEGIQLEHLLIMICVV